MATRVVSPATRQFVDDEMLRAPLLFDQLVDGIVEHAGKAGNILPPMQRSVLGDLVLAVKAHRQRLADAFMRSLRVQVSQELNQGAPRAMASPHTHPAPFKPASLSLVDEESVAMDVELSRAIEAIKSVAEYELRELQTYASALAGDMDVTCDHNPFRAETYANAIWAAAQALTMSRSHQVAFLRHAGEPLAHLLRRSYAASSSRLESMGIEPAAHRTLILPAGSRRGGRAGDTIFGTDLNHIRATMPAPLDVPLPQGGPQTNEGGRGRPELPLPPPKTALSYQGQAASAIRTAAREHWSEIARKATTRADQQAVELVSRLFDAVTNDERVPDDIKAIIFRLRVPAMRLALRDPGLLDGERHPLWQFINKLVYEAEMAPDAADPERVQLLRLAHSTIQQLLSEPEQNGNLYVWALERLTIFLKKRLTRRLAAASTQIAVLQKLEDRLTAGQTPPSTLQGILDVPELDTVPADLMQEQALDTRAPSIGEGWLGELMPGDWIRMFIQGHWVRARLLWPGERREVWLFGDGASDATWAVRRGALVLMHREKLAKTLRQRSIVATAAAKVQAQVAAAVTAA
jgi:hypothetical protein